MGELNSSTGTQAFIGPVVTGATDTAAEFAALTPYVELDMLEKIGEFGDERNIVTGSTLKDGRVRKAGGAYDGGTVMFTCFHDPADAGQIALAAALKVKSKFAFKIIKPDGDATHTNTTQYFRGVVASCRYGERGNDNLDRNMYNVAVDSETYQALSALIP